MKTSYRWIAFNNIGERLIKSAIDGLVKLEYTEHKKSGYIIQSRNPRCASFKYVERFEHKEIVTGPFGDNIEYTQIRFQEISFSIFPKDCFIEFRNPPRSISVVLSEFAKMTDHSIEYAPTDVDVIAWQRAIISHAPDFWISMMRVSDMRMADNIKAQIQLTGESDVYDETTSIIKKNMGAVTRSRLTYDGIYFELSANMSAISNTNDEKHMTIVRLFLLSARSSHP